MKKEELISARIKQEHGKIIVLLNKFMKGEKDSVKK
jgi:hypothetical protein